MPLGQIVSRINATSATAARRRRVDAGWIGSLILSGWFGAILLYIDRRSC
jgi:hypothetical protein